MQIRRLTIATLLTTLLAATPAAADSDGTPTLTVNPGVLTAGSCAKVCYSNPSMAGQTVVVDVASSSRGGTPTPLEITLDANGNGTVTWTVPHWFGATFNAPGCAEVFVPIE